MKSRLELITVLSTLTLSGAGAFAAETVPTDVQMPGTQPGEVSGPRSTRCENCHGGGYDITAEPGHTWRGSMMAHAGRDPIFWATLAIAEQDFDGAGDLCIRCHQPGAWLEGRSTPTDGSALTDADVTWGVQCDLCHRLTNPDDSEHLGVHNPPFTASTGGEGHYGSGQYVLSDENNLKLGPYDDAQAKHGSAKSLYHRDPALCGTCHDVSNPVVGDLAPNNGAQTPLLPGTFNGALGGDPATKAAFNNPPYKYGVVERTFSEHMASSFPTTPVSAYATLPADLQAGSIETAYLAATAGVPSGDYADGDTRFFTCQTCHMRPAAGTKGCNKAVPARADNPTHDLTGGNYWMPAAIQYMDSAGTLLLGGGLTTEDLAAMDDGALRARANLEDAASLTVSGDSVRVTNLTGHKLISGYPEGRRMWLNIKWYDDSETLLREDGAYGPITTEIDGQPTLVDSIIDLHDANTTIFEAHGGVTQAWAAKLIAVSSAYADVVVGYDRYTGAPTYTLGDIAAQPAGTAHETFHFVLNNTLLSDNRIPPYGMRYDDSVERNILPVPVAQYGNPGPGGTFDHFADVALNAPAGATYATIELLFQPTSWEYIQFLAEANNGQVAFLANEGRNLRDAWLATGMAAPHVMASATWGNPPSCIPTEETETTCDDGIDNDCDAEIDANDSDCQSSSCGNGLCDPGEDCTTCSDCDGVTGGKPAGRYCCGNGVPEDPEGDGAICDGNY